VEILPVPPMNRIFITRGVFSFPVAGFNPKHGQSLEPRPHAAMGGRRVADRLLLMDRRVILYQ
jgi:hypothetical protein